MLAGLGILFGEGARVATQEDIQKVLNSLYDIEGCGQCGTRIRFGDFDCPHCGAELDDVLEAWAERLVAALRKGSG